MKAWSKKVGAVLASILLVGPALKSASMMLTAPATTNAVLMGVAGYAAIPY